jgi:Ca2+:H+ antiporter
VTNTLFMLGMSLLLGGLKHHLQEFNRASARLQAGLLFLATVALLIPSAVSTAESGAGAIFTQQLSVGLAGLSSWPTPGHALYAQDPSRLVCERRIRRRA